MTEKLEKHLAALRAKHASLDTEIAAENARPLPDEVVISELKKQKLKIKEEIETIESNK